MSMRYVCPVDGEVLTVVIDPSTNPVTESYRCGYCHYSATKTVAATLANVTESYVPPSKQKAKK